MADDNNNQWLEDLEPLPIKILRFRLIGPNSKPIPFGLIKINLVPFTTVRRNANTLFPISIQGRTNEFGFAEFQLYANDVLDINTKYKVELSYNGLAYLFLIQITKDMPNIIDFEDLIDRRELQELEACLRKKQDQGIYVIQGHKIYF